MRFHRETIHRDVDQPEWLVFCGFKSIIFLKISDTILMSLNISYHIGIDNREYYILSKSTRFDTTNNHGKTRIFSLSKYLENDFDMCHNEQIGYGLIFSLNFLFSSI